MHPNSPRGFTLLELTVVLAILAVVTAIAVASVETAQDQARYEATQRGLEQIREAVLGSPDARATDGSPTIGGFVSDMGRLPKTVNEGGGVLTLAELWTAPGATFDLRQANAANGVTVVEDQDNAVFVPCGWRGPYLRLPLGTTELLDGWGNAYISPNTATPPDPLATGYHRLRDLNDDPITTAGQPIRIVRDLGANGRLDAADTGYDREGAIVFTDASFQASLIGTVEVLDASNNPATPDSSDKIVVRAYAPDPADPAKIVVISTAPIDFASNPVPYSIPVSSGLTHGSRVVRVAFTDFGSTTTAYNKSGVIAVALHAGPNQLTLKIDRTDSVTP